LFRKRTEHGECGVAEREGCLAILLFNVAMVASVFVVVFVLLQAETSMRKKTTGWKEEGGKGRL
jgi:hypothetical protein